jgi:Phosphotransferase enzyme family
VVHESSLRSGATLEEYASGLADAGLAQIPDAEVPSNDRLWYQGTISENLELLETAREVIGQLVHSPKIPSIPILYHPDLHARNIFVSEEDPTQITAIIDWQSTSIEPVFVYANEEPDIISTTATDAQRAGFIPDMLENVEDPRLKEKRETDLRICQETFAVCLRGWSPAVFAAKTTNETLLRLFRYIPNIWSLGSTAIRQELIQLSQSWSQLGLEGECSYKPSPEDVSKHKEQFDDFESRQRLKLWLQTSLGSDADGWRPSEMFESAREVHKAAFKEWLRSNRDEFDKGDVAATEERARKLWPWDGNGDFDDVKL